MRNFIMEPIARATFHRAICNWQPGALRVATFVPSLERHRLANRRAEFGAFRMHEDRVAGTGKETLLRALEIFDHDGKIKIMIGGAQQVCLELTDNGLRLFDKLGKEQRGTVCIDGEVVGFEMLRKIINCIHADSKQDPGNPAVKLAYFIAEKSPEKEWKVIAFAESIPSTIMDGDFKTFFVLTTEDFSGMMARVEKREVVFCPPSEIIKKPEIEHVRNERSDNTFEIKSYFRCKGIEIEVATRRAGTGSYQYETMVFVGGDIVEHYTNMYKTQEEAELSHWKLVDRLKANRNEDVNRITRFMRFM